MVRVFLGISFNNHSSLCSGQEMLKTILVGSRINWVAPQNFHLTLKFIGECEDYTVNAIQLILKETARSLAPAELELARPGYFGSSKHPKVLWYGLRENGMLNTIQQAIERDLEQAGLEREEKEFHAHITLARVKDLLELREFNRFIEEAKPSEDAKVPVKQFHLYRSVLKPEGPEYSVIESFKLGG